MAVTLRTEWLSRILAGSLEEIFFFFLNHNTISELFYPSKEGQYFSEEQMRFREPLLYEQYIGQYLSEEEILQRAEESMKQGLTGLSDLLINSHQEKELQKRLEEEQDRENCANQEEDEGELLGWGVLY